MDVRSIEDVAPVVEHNGTVPVWWLVDPHSHPTHEFYYVTSGRGFMTIEGEEREIRQGDLVHIPPDAVHSLRPITDNASIHCFCFAVGVPDAGPVDYTNH